MLPLETCTPPKHSHKLLSPDTSVQSLPMDYAEIEYSHHESASSPRFHCVS